MPKRFKPQKRDLYLERMFETRSEAWERVGLSVGEVSEKTVRRARREVLLLVPLLIGVLLVWSHRDQIFGKQQLKTVETPLQIATIIALVAIGWALARAFGRLAGPSFLRRMDPATAGTFGFLVRLITIVITLLLALAIAGVKPQTLAVGGAFTAVVLGLAAQQTLGNVIAGLVLLSARPFRVGERVRLQAGVVGGTAEGTVSSLGLLYTTLTHGYDRMMIPNNVVLAAAIVPLKEPESVDVKVRLTSGVRPSQVQAILDNEISTPTRSSATVLLEEVDGSEVVVRIQATPELADDGAKLADEIIAALSSVTGEHTDLGHDRREPGADERAADERAADERAADERAADERTADERTADERTADRRRGPGGTGDGGNGPRGANGRGDADASGRSERGRPDGARGDYARAPGERSRIRE